MGGQNPVVPVWGTVAGLDADMCAGSEQARGRDATGGQRQTPLTTAHVCAVEVRSGVRPQRDVVEESTGSLVRVWHAKRADDRRERRTSSLTLWVPRFEAAQGAARGGAALGGLRHMRGMGAVPGRG